MRKLFIISSVAILLATSCDRNAIDLPKLEFERFNFDFNCYDEISKNEVIINDQDAFQALLDTTFLNNGSCDSTDLVSIDFTQYTLLGAFRDGSGCSQEFIRNLYIDEENQRYIYETRIEERGGCEPYVYSMNWILAPKLPEGYTIEFIE